jgi:HSP20 family molecular chaperone IbpA
MKKQFTLALLTLCSGVIHAEKPEEQASVEQTQNQQSQSDVSPFDRIFDQMKEEFQHAHEQMRKFEKAMFNEASSPGNDSQSSASVKIDQDESHVRVHITAHDIDKKALKDIRVHNNVLKAHIPTAQSGDIHVTVNPSYIDINQYKHIKQDDEQEKKELSSHSSSQQVMSLPSLVNVAETKAQLKGDTLTLRIAKKTPKKVEIEYEDLDDDVQDLK